MRLLAHIMVFLLSCAALLNSVLVEMEAQRAPVQGTGTVHEQAIGDLATGSVTIYKTTPDVLLPRVREAGSAMPLPHRNDCPIGTCQDV